MKHFYNKKIKQHAKEEVAAKKLGMKNLEAISKKDKENYQDLLKLIK